MDKNRTQSVCFRTHQFFITSSKDVLLRGKKKNTRWPTTVSYLSICFTLSTDIPRALTHWSWEPSSSRSAKHCGIPFRNTHAIHCDAITAVFFKTFVRSHGFIAGQHCSDRKGVAIGISQWSSFQRRKPVIFLLPRFSLNRANTNQESGAFFLWQVCLWKSWLVFIIM